MYHIFGESEARICAVKVPISPRCNCHDDRLGAGSDAVDDDESVRDKQLGTTAYTALN
jgi:hypothetical protein